MITSFKDLETWKIGHQLVLRIYKATESFPQKEAFGLVSQMRRAAVSITSNIAEGFGRRSKKEKVQFYAIAIGSLFELESQVLISRDLSFISAQIFKELDSYLTQTRKLLYGLSSTAATFSEDRPAPTSPNTAY